MEMNNHGVIMITLINTIVLNYAGIYIKVNDYLNFENVDSVIFYEIYNKGVFNKC